MALENNNLERKIREALENLTPEYDPRSWDQLEERLNTDDILNPSDAESIDNLVVQNLANLSVNSSADWSLFEDKLDASENADFEEIDQLAYDRLSQFEAPYESSHWQLMMKRIESELTIQGKLYKYKIAEVALMFLIIFTFINLQPLDHFPINFGSKKSKLNTNNLIEDFSNQKNQNNYLTPQGEVLNNKESNKNIERPIASITIINGTIEKNPKQANSSNSQNNSLVISDKIEVPTRINAPNPLPTSLSPISYNSDQFFGDGFLNNSTATASLAPMINTLIALEASLLNVEENDPDFEFNEPKIEPAKPDWRISFFSATDINNVDTPYDVTFGAPAYTSFAGGYGGGITVAMKMKRIAFETGGLYSFKRYIPEPFSDEPFQPTSLFTEDFKGVQLDILQIPFNVQYHVKNNGKWRFYVNAGASMHMILSPVYELERTWLVPPMPAPFEGDCDTCLPSIKEFPKGILDGGKFKDNTYTTLNTGFGVERFLNNRWSIFMQPTYQHYITKKGVGPNDDKIYSVSFYLGTKVSLK
jgi:hypothetical protein